MPAVSIIIPCYNSGLYIPEAIASIDAYAGEYDYEVIIVDDGSTDKLTLDFLASLLKEKYIVIHQENQGPAAARNTGVEASKGKYILFLDSDNKIRTDYIDIGINIFDAHADVGVVYGNAAFFGTTSIAQFHPAEFDMVKILYSNYIDMCSLVRRKVWQEVGGLDEDRRLIGHEDWEFWIRIGKTKWRFFHINHVLFDYRIRTDSLTTQAAQEQKFTQMLSYVYGKHWELFRKYYKHLSRQFDYYKYDQAQPFRTFIKFLYKKYFSKNGSESI